MSHNQPTPPRLREIASLFLKLGIFAFGGPAAHIAMMEEEVVQKRQWMDQQHFLDLVGATSLIPGPNSTEMTMHCGHERGGAYGLFIAGASFILPAVLITGGLAYLYVEYGQLPQVAPLLYGIKPAVLAVILSAVIKLGGKALKSRQLGVIGGLATLAVLLGINEIFAILGAGALGLALHGLLRLRNAPMFIPLPLLLFQATASTSGAASASLGKLFLTFLKVGSILFGSGYVLVAYLDGELVQKLGWLTRPELLDAIAIGQFTPGPVLSTATFVGYQILGFWGAVAATLGIFLPSFFFVWLLNPLVPKIRESKAAGAFLDAVNIGAVGIMAAVVLQLGAEVLPDWKAWVVAGGSALAVFGPWKVSSVWVILGGAVLGWGLSWV
ncbi:MAG: chromate efflux transporter [Lewinellaceae bacterium]|nr:chromate efflux transporter [Phaeodactylibacter sp.]MCB9036898.1 chromate efflux transporter [Lewinellaceae bacterium]